MLMFRVLWSQLTMLLHLVDQDCVGACHLKNYCFVITYLLEDEQELSLGMLIRCKRIYNFWCSMPVLHQLSYVLSMLRCTFYTFSGTNLLTRCHSASSCFLLFLVSEKVTQEIFSKLDVTKANIPIFTVRKRRTEDESNTGARWPQPCLGAAYPWPAPMVGVGPSGVHRPRPLAHIFSEAENT